MSAGLTKGAYKDKQSLLGSIGTTLCLLTNDKVPPEAAGRCVAQHNVQAVAVMSGLLHLLQEKVHTTSRAVVYISLQRP